MTPAARAQGWRGVSVVVEASQMAEIILNVDVREGVGTGGARAARRAGFVPGVLYGGDKAPVALSVNEKDFRKSLYTGKLLGHLVTLKYGDETQPVIAKDVQFDPVSDRPLHFDLMRVDEHAPVKIEVPVHFKNEANAPGIKRGGVLNIVLHEITVRTKPATIPEFFEVDLTGLEIGHSVHLSALKVPDGVRVVTRDKNPTVASIAEFTSSAINTTRIEAIIRAFPTAGTGTNIAVGTRMTESQTSCLKASSWR